MIFDSTFFIISVLILVIGFLYWCINLYQSKQLQINNIMFLAKIRDEGLTLQNHNITNNLPEDGCRACGEVHMEPYDHSVCVTHGHCLQPIQCTLHKDCPTNRNGPNPLSWSKL